MLLDKNKLLYKKYVTRHIKIGQENKQNPKTGKSPGFFQKSFITRLQELGLS